MSITKILQSINLRYAANVLFVFSNSSVMFRIVYASDEYEGTRLKTIDGHYLKVSCLSKYCNGIGNSRTTFWNITANRSIYDIL